MNRGWDCVVTTVDLCGARPHYRARKILQGYVTLPRHKTVDLTPFKPSGWAVMSEVSTRQESMLCKLRDRKCSNLDLVEFLNGSQGEVGASEQSKKPTESLGAALAKLKRITTPWLDLESLSSEKFLEQFFAKVPYLQIENKILRDLAAVGSFEQFDTFARTVAASEFEEWTPFDFLNDALNSECICHEGTHEGLDDDDFDFVARGDKEQWSKIDLDNLALGGLPSVAEVRRRVRKATWYQNLKRFEKYCHVACPSCSLFNASAWLRKCMLDSEGLEPKKSSLLLHGAVPDCGKSESCRGLTSIFEKGILETP